MNPIDSKLEARGSTERVLTPLPGVMKLPPYEQGQSTIDGVEAPIKLSSNESALGASPRAQKAFSDSARHVHRYPDGTQTELRNAIGQLYGMDPGRVICGNGSEELILLAARAYVSTGDEVLLSQNGFIMSNVHCTAQGAELVIAPETEYCVDVDALLDRVTKRTRFCTIANPNNPTGTYISADELRRLHAGLPPDCLFLIDSAYAEYVEQDDYSAGTELVDEFDNVVMTRTFSKIYGLAGLRIGWAYCPESVIAALQRIRTPFNANGPAMAAAVAAVQDTEFVEHAREHNRAALRRLEAKLDLPGLEFVPSVANFYLLKFHSETGKSGSGAAQFLQSRGIIPRPAGGSDAYLRITVGLDHENEAVIAALTDYMNA